ncbi:glycosyltransferase family 2 protein [Sphingobium subterraneum]|uniref:GT2 family glycosyltransferase n=1 Tax=Sphingobium subterraneum TaxID=627688 RepID=A0A841IU94_9SPHN|nr:glycosyltransferase family A protein [Sphingobium subterraneum]MBB6122489.1 GT2 family glycosyltransferase [Sphingobium subterraneum]
MSLPPSSDAGSVGIVAIGRNEGARFVACLASLPRGLPVVYVDSGSTDGSLKRARESGASVVNLDTSTGFTAARARNAGLYRLLADHPSIQYVQFIDGDCALDADWLTAGLAALTKEPGLAVVFGRRREMHPEASIYNAQCDREWDVPVGEVRACGGDALMRVAAVTAVGGYTEALIAGEEPDLCLRMRAKGWKIRRIAAEMTRHDADIHDIRSWWRRTKRSGHAYAEHVWIHGKNADPSWVRQCASLAIWGLAFPAFALVGLFAALVAPVALVVPTAILMLYLVQFARLRAHLRRGGLTPGAARADAALLLLGKVAQVSGALSFLWHRLTRRRSALIEYKR